MERKNWLDALRALAILFVVFGHQVKGWSVFFLVTSPIKMPLFFVISGYLFKMRDGDSTNFYKNLFVKLIVPWIALSLIAYLPKITCSYDILIYLKKLIRGDIFWFMPCFIFSQSIHFYIRKFVKSILSIGLLSIMVCILGFIANYLDVLNFGMINRAMIVQAFFLLGFLFREYEMSLIRIGWKYIALGFAIYIVLIYLSVFIFSQATIDVHTNRYYNIPYCFIIIVLGCMLLCMSFSKAKINNYVLNIIGQNTLIIYMWHGLFIGLLVKLIPSLGLYESGFLFKASIKTIWALLACLCCAYFINKYMPELVGRKRLK